MANKFEKKEWEDRQSQYPSRRRLTPTNIENVYEVERAEGDVTEPGNAFDANNMNDMENRIYDAFSKLDGTDITVLDKNNVFSKTLLEDVLIELFTYASNGKTLIANAIGGSASAKFKELADLAGSIKTDRDNGKTLIANAIGETRNGTASASESFSYLADRIILDKMSFWGGSVGGSSGFQLQISTMGTTSRAHVSKDFGFLPNRILITSATINFGGRKSSQTQSELSTISFPIYSGITSDIGKFPTIGTCTIDNISKNGFDIIMKSNYVSSYYDIIVLSLYVLSSAYIYAFKV